MKNLIADVLAFHIATDCPHFDTPILPPQDRVELRYKLIAEEVREELLPAMARGTMNDLPEIADAMADSLYVVVGTALEYGIQLPEFPLPELCNPRCVTAVDAEAIGFQISLSVGGLLRAIEHGASSEALLSYLIKSSRVLCDAAHSYGIPLAAVWDAVQAANMAKVDPVTGKVRRREDGKILKPDGWQPPNIAAVLWPSQQEPAHA